MMFSARLIHSFIIYLVQEITVTDIACIYQILNRNVPGLLFDRTEFETECTRYTQPFFLN